MKTSIAFGTTQMGLGELAWRQLGRFVAEIRRAHARRKAYAVLAALDDRTLNDIGIARSEIEQAVDKALGAKPAARRAADSTRVRGTIAA